MNPVSLRFAATASTLLLAAACSGTINSVPMPTSSPFAPTIQLNPSSLTFDASGPANAQSVNATLQGYSGTFTQKNRCGPVARIAVTKNGGGAATYRVTPLRAGTCQATISAAGLSAVLPIEVRTGGRIVVEPTSMLFDGTGVSQAKTATVTQANYRGSFAETDDCRNLARVEPVRNAAGKAVFRVVPLAKGGCSAHFTGAGKSSGKLSIRVAPAGPVEIVPASLDFPETGKAHSEKVTVTQTNFSGSFTETDTCAGKATVAQHSNGGGSAVYVVTPVAAGSCKATFKGSGRNGVLPIAVHSTSNVVAVPGSLQFSEKGDQQIVVTQKGYDGSFKAFDDCKPTASLAEVSNAGGKAVYRVTAHASGSCIAVFTGAAGKAAAVPIDVKFPGGVVAEPAPLDFSATGSAHAVTQTVTQKGYEGTFAEQNTCSHIASVVAKGRVNGKETYEVTPLGPGTCDVTYTGKNSETFVSHTTVTTSDFAVANVSRNADAIDVLADGALVQQIALTPSSDARCTGNGTTVAIVCAGLELNVAPGQYDFTFEAKSGGTLLSISDVVPAHIAVGGHNAIGTATLNSILSGIQVSATIPNGGLAPNVPTGGPVTIDATDPSGAAILAGVYITSGGARTSITVSSDLTDPFTSAMVFSIGGAPPLPSVDVTKPADIVLYHYNGLIHPAFDILATSGSISATFPISQGDGTIALTLVCASARDSCVAQPPGIFFTAVGRTARIVPSEPGWTNAPFNQLLTLSADTCNTTDDPSAGGDWASFSPVVGTAATAYTATALNAGTSGNAAVCTGTISDPLGGTASFGLSVTLSKIGVHIKR